MSKVGPPTTHLNKGNNWNIPLFLVALGIFVISFIAILTNADQFQTNERFTEFFLSGDIRTDQVNDGLDKNLLLTLNVGITNREGSRVSYRVLTLIDKQIISIGDDFTLGHNDTKLVPVELPLTSQIYNQTIEVVLEREGFSSPYRILSFNLDQ